MRNNKTLFGLAMLTLAVTLALSSFLASTTSARVTAYAILRAGATIGITDLGQINLTPASTKGVRIGGATSAPAKNVLSATASIDFTALAAGTCETFTVTVTGAADGDPVALGIPAAAFATTEYATIEGFVSAANTVTLKRCNLTNETTALSNPAAVTVRATVFQF